MNKRKLVVIPPAGREQLQGRNPEQSEYLKLLKDNEQVFAIGRAGTGKTYIPTAYAADLFISKDIKKLILTRPAVGAGGEQHGFLPGDLSEKLAPWMMPFIDILTERLGKGNVDDLMAAGKIVVEPFQYMRGRTFDDAIIILDEAQNTTPEQMKLFLTRQGVNSKTIIIGDVKQTDLNKKNGLTWALNLNRQFDISPVITLTQVERGKKAGQWADAIEEEEEGR